MIFYACFKLLIHPHFLKDVYIKFILYPHSICSNIFALYSMSCPVLVFLSFELILNGDSVALLYRTSGRAFKKRGGDEPQALEPLLLFPFATPSVEDYGGGWFADNL